MKLSLVLSALLVGGSLFMSGCDSSSSDDVDNPVVNDTIDTVTALEFTTEMFAGKTFYTYKADFENGFQGGEARMQFNFSADASTVEAISMQEENYGDNFGSLPVIISDDLMSIAIYPQLLLKIDGENMYVTEDTDPSLWSPTQLSDNGTAIYTALFAADNLTNEILASSKWHNLEVTYDDNDNKDFECKNTFTFDSDGTGSTPIEDGETFEFTYNISEDDKFSIDNTDMSMSYIMKSENILHFTDNILFFESKEAAKNYLLKMGESESDSESCISNFIE